MRKNDSDLMKIGEFARRGDVSRRSLRHYEDLGILSPKKRSSGGFRLYEEKDLFKLEIIKIFKELGFSLEEINEILTRSQSNEETSKEKRLDHSQEVLNKQLREVEEKLQKLKERHKLVKRGLDALAECRDCPQNACPDKCKNRRYFI